MASFGKKILSAFVDLTEEEKTVTVQEEKQKQPTPLATAVNSDTATAEKFKQYFDRLFTEANLPGPDYFEFAKMIQAMTAFADERARYSAAYAGLNVQGLDKNKLLDTAAAYLKILETDAANFNATVDAALLEKVQAKKQEITDKQQRTEQLAREMNDLQHQIELLQLEIKENEEKIRSNTGGYATGAQNRRQQIVLDIEKIKQYIA
jgi:chromosome segregation ATPase